MVIFHSYVTVYQRVKWLDDMFHMKLQTPARFGAVPILCKDMVQFNHVFFVGSVNETTEQDGACSMTNCTKPRALPG